MRRHSFRLFARSSMAFALALLAVAACGLDVAGSSPESPTSDASSEQTPTSDAGADVQTTDVALDTTPQPEIDAGPPPPTCADERLKDPSIQTCLDFDQPTASDVFPFGFDSISIDPTLTVQLSASPLGPRGGNGLAFALAGGGQGRFGTAIKHIADQSTFNQFKRVQLDVDAVIDANNIEYLALLVLNVTGPASCATITPGISIKADGFYRTTAPGAPAIAKLPISGTPIHLRLTAAINNAGSDNAESIAINGVDVSTAIFPTDPSCNHLQAFLGTMYTGNGSVVVRYDHFVLRVQ